MVKNKKRNNQRITSNYFSFIKFQEYFSKDFEFHQPC